jgi:hypothetical protein
LKPDDNRRRLQLSHEFLAKAEINPDFLDSILWSDESTFTLCGQVNNWNTRIWASEPPQEIVQVPHFQKRSLIFD